MLRYLVVGCELVGLLCVVVGCGVVFSCSVL